jgi:hypothetical protein
VSCGPKAEIHILCILLIPFFNVPISWRGRAYLSPLCPPHTENDKSDIPGGKGITDLQPYSRQYTDTLRQLPHRFSYSAVFDLQHLMHPKTA